MHRVLLLPPSGAQLSQAHPAKAAGALVQQRQPVGVGQLRPFAGRGRGARARHSQRRAGQSAEPGPRPSPAGGLAPAAPTHCNRPAGGALRRVSPSQDEWRRQPASPHAAGALVPCRHSTSTAGSARCRMRQSHARELARKPLGTSRRGSVPRAPHAPALGQGDIEVRARRGAGPCRAGSVPGRAEQGQQARAGRISLGHPT